MAGAAKVVVGNAKVDWKSTLVVLQDSLADDRTVQDTLKEAGRVLQASGSQHVPKSCKVALEKAAKSIAETALDPLLAEEAKDFVELLHLDGGHSRKSGSPKRQMNIHEADPDSLQKRWASIAALELDPSPAPVAGTALACVLELDPASVPMAGTAKSPMASTATVCGMELDPTPTAAAGSGNVCGIELDASSRDTAPSAVLKRPSLIRRGRWGYHVHVQTQALLAIGHDTLMGLTAAQRKLIAEIIPASSGRTRSATKASQILSGLFGLRTPTIQNAVLQFKKHQGKARKRPRVYSKAPTQPDCKPPRSTGKSVDPRVAGTAIADLGIVDAPVADTALADTAMVTVGAARGQVPTGFFNAVRACLFCSVHGHPKIHYPEVINLMSLANADIGHSHHHRHFVSLCENAAHHLLSACIHHDINAIMPSVGVPRDLELIVDSGTIGRYFSRSSESLLLVGVIHSIPCPPYSKAVMLDCINEGHDARAPAMAQYIKQAFAHVDPSSQTDFEQFFANRIAISCGDGALVAGGEERTQKKLGLNLLAKAGFVSWDAFHLIDKAGSHALKSSPAAGSFLNLLKSIEKLLGLGQGRHLDRAMAAWLEQPYLVCRSSASIKKFAYIGGVPERFLEKFGNYYRCIIVRMRRAFDGRGSQTFTDLKEMASKMVCLQQLIFATCLSVGSHRLTDPISKEVQDHASLPWTRWQQLNSTQQGLHRFQQALGWLRRNLRVLLLLTTYLPPQSLRRYWMALVCSPTGRLLHGKRFNVAAVTFGTLFTQRFQGCQMIGLIPYIPVGQNLAHPACQCGTRPQFIPGSRHHYRGGGDIKHGSTVRFQVHEEADEPDEQADEPVAATAGAEKKKKITRIRRKIKAPWWVSRTLYLKSSLQASGKVRDPVTEHPRWQKFSNTWRGICRRRCKVAVVNNIPQTEINKL